MEEKRAKKVTVKISPKKIKRIKEALAEIEALKRELGLEEGEKEENPKISNLDLLLFMTSRFSELGDKLSWLLGAVAVATGLLIAMAVAIF